MFIRKLYFYKKDLKGHCLFLFCYILGGHSRQNIKYKSRSRCCQWIQSIFNSTYLFSLPSPPPHPNFCCRFKSTLPEDQTGILTEHTDGRANFLPSWPKHHLWQMKRDCFAQSRLDPSCGHGTESAKVKMNPEAHLSLNHPHSWDKEGKGRKSPPTNDKWSTRLAC